MFDLLQLDGWTVSDLWDEGGEIVIEATYGIEPEGCPKCGVIGGLYRHGPKRVRYRDSPIRGQAVTLQAKAQRYRCRECSETSIQPLDGIDSTRQMTVRCREHIEEQCLRKTFADLACDVGVDEKTVRNIAKGHIQNLDRAFSLQAPEWLGIDELHVAGDVRAIFTDVGNKLPVDMLAKRTKPNVARWLNRLPGKERVEGVTMDMWRPYRDLVRQELPRASVIVDKYHVLAMVNRGLDSVRKSLWKKQTKEERRHYKRRRHILLKRPHKLTDKQHLNLTGWLNNEPELRKAHELKEFFWDIYEMDREAATEAIRAWPGMIPDYLEGHFREAVTAVGNWEPEILAYFDTPYTNAYTEMMNGVAKTIYRQGRGYSFEVLRARVLFRYRKVGLPPGSAHIKPEFARRARQAMATRLYLLAESDGTCWSCRGTFSEDWLRVTHVHPGRPSSAVLMCGECQERLHRHMANPG